MHIQIAAITILFFGLLMIGILALLPLFHWRFGSLIDSKLFVKSVMWVPLFVGFVFVIYGKFWAGMLVAAIIDIMAYRELTRQKIKKVNLRRLSLAYYSLFVACSFQLLTVWQLPAQDAVDLIVTACFASVLSDVVAFFSGNYFGRHKLPKRLNPNKSWEGVTGQFAGALIGVILLQLMSIDSFFWLWIPIALGTTLGDLTNSYVKRRLAIKDWSDSIPGHGGYIDRFISLLGGLSLGLLFYFVFTG